MKKKSSKKGKPHPYVVALIESAPAWFVVIFEAIIKLLG